MLEAEALLDLELEEIRNERFWNKKRPDILGVFAGLRLLSCSAAQPAAASRTPPLIPDKRPARLSWLRLQLQQPQQPEQFWSSVAFSLDAHGADEQFCNHRNFSPSDAFAAVNGRPGFQPSPSRAARAVKKPSRAGRGFIERGNANKLQFVPEATAAAMETRRHRRGKKRFLLPLSILCLAVLLPAGALLAPSASASSPAASAGGGSRKRRWAGFDYYVLALQWPGTICRQTSNCCETNGCCRYHFACPLSSHSIFALSPQETSLSELTDKAPNSRSYCPRYVTFPSYKPSVLANNTAVIGDQANGELHAYDYRERRRDVQRNRQSCLSSCTKRRRNEDDTCSHCAQKKHLYLVLDDWIGGYSIHKLDADNMEEHLPKHAAIRVASPERGNPMAFANLGTNIFIVTNPHCSHDRAPPILVYDTANAALAVGPRRGGPKEAQRGPRPSLTRVKVSKNSRRKPNNMISGRCPPHFLCWSAPGPRPPVGYLGDFGQSVGVNGKLYALTTSFSLELQFCSWAANPDQQKPWDPPMAWSWNTSPAPPPQLIGEHLVTAYALHPDGHTVFVSTDGCHTHSLDTSNGVWRDLGAWTLPFKGQAYYNGELDAWVGLHHEQDGYRHDDEEATTRVHDSQREVVPTRATLTYMGDSRFCLVENVLRNKANNLDAVVHVTLFGLEYDHKAELRAKICRTTRSETPVPTAHAPAIDSVPPAAGANGPTAAPGERERERETMAMTAARKGCCVLLVWALAAAGLGSASARAPLVGSSSKPQREFDYFALSLQWPGTICASTRHCCAINGCCRYVRRPPPRRSHPLHQPPGSEPLQTFTIHGLWPDYDDGTWPSCCRRTQFDLDKILPLMETLQKYWPSLYCSSSSTCFSGKGLFWAHEVQ
ncbi:hypothetical protein HU200_011318 [Digitaria exilis]|uniref:Uncharacterized protein n=1 Tax=Digitaria exilis TaxID=1010633 RepID=A0A835FIQ6_9POAL|nr:hypothetical protein HU200_011318 [Digitaria exilis]